MDKIENIENVGTTEKKGISATTTRENSIDFNTDKGDVV